MKNIFVYVVAILFATSVNAQKDPAAKVILDAMSAKYESIPAFKANFSYIMEDPEEGINEGFEGLITVMKDKYRLEMGGQEIINNGVTVWTFLKDDNEVTVSDFDPEEQELSLSTIFSIYEKGYKYLFLDNESTGVNDFVDLVPEDLEKTFYKIRMEIDKSTSALKSFRVFDKSGSRYLYRINDFSEENSITEKDFTFNESAFPDVEVIDFR
jgi:outer membrane lipoprotein-sorting protein